VSPVEVIVEVIADPGRVVLAVTAPDGAGLELDMSADECRSLVNQLGAGIKAAASRAEVSV
jgi:hypothetical protein